MKNPFSGLFRARDKPQDSVSAAPVFYFGTSGSGKSVTVQSAIQLSTVYACVRVISETIASLPLGIYETVNDGNEKATDHPLYRLLHDEPNSEMMSFVFREVMLAHLLLYGNSYSQIIRSGKNQVIGLYPLLPDHMDVDRDSKGNLTYTYTTSDGKTVLIKPRDVLHIPGLGFDGVMGYSRISTKRIVTARILSVSANTVRAAVQAVRQRYWSIFTAGELTYSLITSITRIRWYIINYLMHSKSISIITITDTITLLMQKL
ncbi:MAG: phage portal protein [Clostridia bacterium]|nr:phage portal protein [Clostridia bacterium]